MDDGLEGLAPGGWLTVIELAEGLGDYATAEMLREQLEDLEEHVHVIDHYLEDDTLVHA